MESIVGAAKGNVPVLKELYETYGPRLYGFVWHVTGDEKVASKIIVDVLLCLWKDGLDGDDTVSVFTKLLRLTRSHVVSHYRSTELSYVRTASQTLSPSADEQNSQLVSMFFFEGKSFAQIADVLGIPAIAARDKVMAAIAAVREIVQKRNP